MEEIRLICKKCGACAGHPEDRVGKKCKYCGAMETEIQVLTKDGWVTVRSE